MIKDKYDKSIANIITNGEILNTGYPFFFFFSFSVILNNSHSKESQKKKKKLWEIITAFSTLADYNFIFKNSVQFSSVAQSCPTL